MFNRSAEPQDSISILKETHDSKSLLEALPCKLDIKRHSSSILQDFRFFQDWWADVANGAKNIGSYSEMMGPSISN